MTLPAPVFTPSPTFTVFTATYNRAHTLTRVYRSLVDQTFTDFEWLIVDDGSRDNTPDLVQEFIRDGKVNIRYFNQENSGKHIAFNRGVREAKGILFLNFDSDDSCVPEALDTFLKYWNAIPDGDRNRFTGVTARCQGPDGERLGGPYPSTVLDMSSLDMRFKWKLPGERWGMHRLDVLKSFPFPDLPGQKFITEDIVWDAVGKKYITRFIDVALRTYNVGDDQLTKKIGKSMEFDLVPQQFYAAFELNNNIYRFWDNPIHFFKCGAKIVRFRLHAMRLHIPLQAKVTSFWGRMLAAAGSPVGLAVFLNDRLKGR